MNEIEIGMVLLLVAVGIMALAPRFKVPMEVLLLLGSLTLSFIPGLPPIELRSEVVFLIFLPPILFAAAYFTSWRDFKANRGTISLLAVGLVLFTTCAVAVVLKWLVPSVSWPVAFILGAMVSPPDASAATAITRKLGVPRRLVTVIEGESLVNDSTALVAYKFAVVAALTGVFSLPMAILRFVWVAVGGVVLGLAVAASAIWLYRRLRETTAQILLSFITAFGAYFIGELCGVSSVIATVTAGLYFGKVVPATASAELRIEAKAGWDLALLVINAFVFMLMGFQLPEVLANIKGYGWKQMILCASAISFTVIAARFLWIFPVAHLRRLLFPWFHRNNPVPPYPVLFVLSWTAMRGIVTLAAALALPAVLPDGSAFPHRHLLIFLAYTVILVTLLLPTLTLPKIFPLLGIKTDDDQRCEEVQARIAAVKEVLEAIPTFKQNAGLYKPHIEDLEKRYTRRLQILEANLADAAFSPLFDEDARARRLLREVIAHERHALVRLRDESVIHNDVFHQLIRELDLEDLRLHTQRL